MPTAGVPTRTAGSATGGPPKRRRRCPSRAGSRSRRSVPGIITRAAWPHESSSAGVSRAAVQLAFVTSSPASGEANGVISPALQVAVQDSLGNTVLGATRTVTVALAANPSEAVLLGTTTVATIDGIATFADLRVDRPGSGYTLAASGDGLTTATTAPFAVHVIFTSVDGGYVHTCGVTTDGAAD